MKTYTFTPSINIVRDFNQDINYIATPNVKQVYGQIISNYQKGSRSFNLIGSYGTGKSAFILSLEQSLNGKASVFNKAALFDGLDKFTFVNIIGENKSLIEVVANRFKIDNSDLSASDIIYRIDSFHKENEGALVIVIDEFGKFLEYAAKNNTEKELYFIQQLAEFANDKTKEVLFLTVLHQNFNAYSLDMSKTQVDEWNKVKGRLVELNFNEPVEQLLLLASDKIQGIQHRFNISEDLKDLHQSIEKSKLFPLRDYGNLSFSKKLYPFDLLSASILTLSLQEYAQNERSLFSFIENDDELGLYKLDQDKNPFYNLACVYDYLVYYHFSFLSTKYNPHLNNWNAIKEALEKAEDVFPENFAETAKLIKTIGLLNLFSKKGGSIDKSFIESYGKWALGISGPIKVIDKLEKQGILHFTKFDRRYKIKEGTDLDFEIAINEAGNLIERVKDVTHSLNKYFDFPVLSAKKISYEKGTPRFFQFVLSDEPIKKTPEDEIDGFVNLIFNNETTEEEILAESKKCKEAILFGWYTQTDKIEDTIFDIEKINKVIEKHADDKIAVRELKVILKHYQSLLNHYVIDRLYAGDDSVKWYFAGEKIKIKNQKEFNNQLSSICNKVYSSTPIFKNELVNKTRISGTISSARKNLFNKILNEAEIQNYGFDDEKFPPEKTIFLSLIENTGIYKFENGIAVYRYPEDSSFEKLWTVCSRFLDQSKVAKKPITDLIGILKQRPFKLKQGFVDFWIPLFLAAHQTEFALFYQDKITGKSTYIPYLNGEVFDLIYRTPQDYLVKKFDLTDQRLRLFNKYREVLNQIEQEDFSNKAFIETFRPFLIFYKNLSPFSQNTSRLSDNAIKLRKAIETATDPEEAFFKDIPKAFDLSLDELFNDEKKIVYLAVSIKEGIHEINSAYENLIGEIEKFINDEVLGESLRFPKNKESLQNRYKKLKVNLLKPKLQVFYNRVTTLLDDRNSWINSISQACIGKSLENISDEEIDILKHQILENIRELDNFTDLSIKDIDTTKEEVIKIEVTSFLKGLSKKYIRIPKAKIEKINTLERSFKEQLKENDKTFNIALLTKLLQDELKDEES
ncbi:MAG TPA: hypothetical protein P5514_05285 [Bacteroidales bacterium]|nr:hypothetical protein [Bacteroidales bacterium]HRX96337.1 hypothetical protein [Bacteroidales bacterium]